MKFNSGCQLGCLHVLQEAPAKCNLCSVPITKMTHKVLTVHLAGVSNLMATEGKHHTSCYMKFLRNISKTKNKSTNTDMAIEWLIDELKGAAISPECMVP